MGIEINSLSLTYKVMENNVSIWIFEVFGNKTEKILMKNHILAL